METSQFPAKTIHCAKTHKRRSGGFEPAPAQRVGGVHHERYRGSDSTSPRADRVQSARVLTDGVAHEFHRRRKGKVRTLGRQYARGGERVRDCEPWYPGYREIPA